MPSALIQVNLGVITYLSTNQMGADGAGRLAGVLAEWSVEEMDEDGRHLRD